MSLPSVVVLFESLCNSLNSNGSVEDISQLFSKLKTDEDRVTFASNLLTEFRLLPSNHSYTECNKDIAKSVEFRNEGNKEFQKKNDSQAMLLYTESIAVAPFPSQSRGQTSTDLLDHEEREDPTAINSDALALGFANRSAVLFSKEQYDACLMDIDQAFKYNYPNNLKYKLFERKGKCLQRKGRLEEAHGCFTEALESLHTATSLSEQKKESLQNLQRTLHDQLNVTDLPKQLSQYKQENVIPLKSYGQHMQILSASNCVDIGFIPEMGRFLEATRDIHPGDVIVVEKPYASVLLPFCFKTHCYNCLRRHQTLIPCLQCCAVMYCSENCRTTSWEKYHCIDCPLLPLLQTLDINKMGLLALRIVIVASACGKNIKDLQDQLKYFEQELQTETTWQGFDDDGFYKFDNYSTIFSLIGNTEKRTVSDLFKRAVTAACLLNCLESKSEFFKGEESTVSSPEVTAMVGGLLLRHLQNLPCNAHEVSEHIQEVSAENKVMSNSFEIGAAAYATLSLINHSCDPNVTRNNHQGDTVVLRAIRPIKNREQILDNYGYHYALHGREERRSHLEAQYYFNCQCEACCLDWPLYHDLPISTSRYKCSQCNTILENSQVICSNCNTENNISDLKTQIEISSEKFQDNLANLLSESEDDFTTELISHLELLDRRICRPWKEYNDCQEALKQCFVKTGNYYVL